MLVRSLRDETRAGKARTLLRGSCPAAAAAVRARALQRPGPHQFGRPL